MVRGVASDPLTVEDIRGVPGGPGGLQSGDIVLAIDGNLLPPTEEFTTFAEELEAAPRPVYTVSRDGAEVDVEGPWLYPPIATGIAPGSAAEKAGLMTGDVVMAVNGEGLFDFTELQTAIRSSGGEEVMLDVWRDGEMLRLAMTPRRQDMPLPEGGFETHFMIGMNGSCSAQASWNCDAAASASA